MTSQKSLNNVNRNDFVRSLKESLLFPLIAFVVLFFFMTAPVISYVTNEDFLMQTVHNEISVFIPEGTSFYYYFDSFIPIGMIICGMLTAVKSFYYLLSKKQVNVFFSLGVKRNTMLKNRILSAVITLFTAVFVPMFLIYIINIVNFGMSAHLTKLFLYAVMMLFVCGFLGFAMASSMLMVSGNIFEAVIATASLSFISYATSGALNYLSHGWLKGYVNSSVYTSWITLFNPWTMATNIKGIFDGQQHARINKLFIPLINETGAENFKIPEELNVDIMIFLPVIIWLVVALVLIGATFRLYSSRKAEHANSLGKFAVSRAVIGTLAFVCVALVVAGGFTGSFNLFALFCLTVVCTFVAYAVVQLVLTRKVKTTFKSFKWYGVLVAVAALCMITVGTGLFGTYNKLPDIKDVKSVSVSTNELEMFPHHIFPSNPGEDFVESSTNESKKMVLELFELLKNEKRVYDADWSASATLAIRDNEGKVKYREFDIYSRETYKKYLELVYGSDFIDAIFKNYLLDDISNIDSSGYFKKWLWACTDTDMLERTDKKYDFIDDVDGLAEALYKDLSVMSVEQLLKNNEKPVCVLLRGYEDMDFPGEVPVYADEMMQVGIKDGLVISYDGDENINIDTSGYGLLNYCILVYSDMTNTLTFLNENGYLTEEEPLTIKEVLYTDGMLTWRNAAQKYTELNTKKNDERARLHKRYYSSYQGEAFEQYSFVSYQYNDICYLLDEPMRAYDTLKKVYKDSGHPLKSVTDTGKAQEIFDNTVSRYMYLGDEGRFVYVVYEEGVIVCYYLPEANMSVIK